MQWHLVYETIESETCFPELSNTEHGAIQYENRRHAVRDSQNSKYSTGCKIQCKTHRTQNTALDSKYSTKLTGLKMQYENHRTHNEMTQYYKQKSPVNRLDVHTVYHSSGKSTHDWLSHWAWTARRRRTLFPFPQANIFHAKRHFGDTEKLT